jgi:hypothetical protein
MYEKIQYISYTLLPNYIYKYKCIIKIYSAFILIFAGKKERSFLIDFYV